MRGALVMAMALALGPGCDPPPVEREAPAAPTAPVAVEVPGEGQVYRYVDPADGQVKTASAVDSIPESARSSVLVFDPASPTPAGWEHVADLAAGLPAQTVPTQGFFLKPTVAAPAPSAKAAAAKKGGAHEVVMFSTQGCGYCTKARRFFKKHAVAHSEYDVERDPKAGPKLAELAKRAGVPLSQLQGGVPLIFINGTPHMGFDQGKISGLLGI